MSLTTREVYESSYALTRAVTSLTRNMRNERLDSDDYEDMSRQLETLKARLRGIFRYCLGNVVANPNLLNAYWAAGQHLLDRTHYGSPVCPPNTSNIHFQINRVQPVSHRYRNRIRKAVSV